ncbi:MAG TPA: bifunctional salicylyl-CoA 5-hydroxylase/oxidoreductase [Myxococcaceae bacterium]|nr:bifunctional salicylyl-CoA 5-hydroxylase/oxidoreductase [Myxococcaceae bacterium]
MKIAIVGGGPAGLYFAILMKKQDPAHRVTVIERNRFDQTFGWGVVFSDETLENLLEADAETHQAITRTFAHWDTIDVHLGGQLIRSRGHGFSGISRKAFLRILQERAIALGVHVQFEREVEDLRPFEDADLIVGADGIRSRVRSLHEDVFQPELDLRKNRYIWLGTHKLFDAFTFIFHETRHGLFQVHAYRYDESASTFIVECPEETWRSAGLHECTPEEGTRFIEELFAPWLGGQPLLLNKSTWVNFATVRNRAWHHRNIVLLGDAAHTAHFSIGSGTKLALEDAIALAGAIQQHPGHLQSALEAYEAERRPMVERTQKAAQDSLLWFEDTPRHWRLPPLQMAFSLLTRSKRIGYENMRVRDPELVDRITGWFAERAYAQAEVNPPELPGPPPPMFTPFRLRGLLLHNRVVVSPMAMYSAKDGTPNDFHLVHLGSLALGGAALLVTEMTCVSPTGRITPGCAGMYRPEHIEAWKRIADFVHERSPAKFCLQLGHSGRKGSTRVGWEGYDVPLPSGGWPVISASAIPWSPDNPVPRAATREDMEGIRDEYVHAARAAIECGFDMIELHMAHGYLLASFLSPLINRREDAYGGPIENRLRFPLEVFEAVRAVWPSERPMSVRISAADWAEGGLAEQDAVAIGRAFKAHGCDILHVSTGQTVKHQAPVYGRMWQTRFADLIRNEAGIPTIAVGNIASADQVNTIIATGRADLCALARPHLLNPHWTMAAAAAQGFRDLPWVDPYRDVLPRRRETPPPPPKTE